MKRYSYNEYNSESPRADASGGYIVTVTEKEVLQQFWPYWYQMMCLKFGKEYVDKTFTEQDCINDWVVSNWAWEV